MYLDESIGLDRTIRDPIHEDIKMSDEEVEIIDHNLYNRLHHIRQNGLLYLVFPSSSHTRFEHSLGVLHLTDSIFRSLIRNSQIASNKPTPAVTDKHDAEKDQAIEFNSLDECLLSDLLRISRLSALVHDVGHGPFSHHFDSFAPRVGKILQSIDEPERYSPLIEYFTSEREEDERIEHEDMSCLMFFRIWQDVARENNLEGGSFFDFEAEDISSLVSAVILNETSLIPEEQDLRTYVPLLNDLVDSSPADADRMDYLERDSRSAGVTYGFYDQGRLLKSLLVYKGKSQDSGDEFGALRLGVKKSGLRAAENFVQARFELFVQIYYHKTNRAVQLMLERIAEIAGAKNISVDEFYSGSRSVFQLYSDLTDERFLRILRGDSPMYSLPEDSGQIEKIAERISERDLWKRIYEEDPKTIACMYNALSRNFDKICMDEISPNATKGLEDGASLLIRAESDLYEAVEHTNWLEESAVMRALSEDERKIARIYFYGSDSDTQDALRQKARTLAHNPQSCS